MGVVVEHVAVVALPSHRFAHGDAAPAFLDGLHHRDFAGSVVVALLLRSASGGRDHLLHSFVGVFDRLLVFCEDLRTRAFRCRRDRRGFGLRLSCLWSFGGCESGASHQLPQPEFTFGGFARAFSLRGSVRVEFGFKLGYPHEQTSCLVDLRIALRTVYRYPRSTREGLAALPAERAMVADMAVRAHHTFGRHTAFGAVNVVRLHRGTTEGAIVDEFASADRAEFEPVFDGGAAVRASAGACLYGRARACRLRGLAMLSVLAYSFHYSVLRSPSTASLTVTNISLSRLLVMKPSIS